MTKVKVIQRKSAIKRPKRQKATLQALGLRKINQSVEHTLTPQIRGMIATVHHLVEVHTLDA